MNECCFLSKIKVIYRKGIYLVLIWKVLTPIWESQKSNMRPRFSFKNCGNLSNHRKNKCWGIKTITLQKNIIRVFESLMWATIVSRWCIELDCNWVVNSESLKACKQEFIHFLGECLHLCYFKDDHCIELGQQILCFFLLALYIKLFIIVICVVTMSWHCSSSFMMSWHCIRHLSSTILKFQLRVNLQANTCEWITCKFTYMTNFH